MDKLPDELIEHILDYLGPTQIVTLQAVSRRLLRLARDGGLWRFQCYYDSPKAVINRVGHKGWSQALAKSLAGAQPTLNGHTSMINEAKATKDWDLSDASEKVNWYSEYISRHAELSIRWLGLKGADHQDIRGAALFEDSNGKKLVGPTDDGSLNVWDVYEDRAGSRHLEIDNKPVRGSPGALFQHSVAASGSTQSDAKKNLAFSGVANCVSIDAGRQRAYVAVRDLLNEVDLNSLQIVCQTRYAWAITSLSEMQSPHQPLTVGTSFSLHILDSRVPPRGILSSSGGMSDVEDSIAFLPHKDHEYLLRPESEPDIYRFGGFSADVTYRPSLCSTISSSQPPSMTSLSSFAQIEPSPLSIIHPTDHSIMVAGRFPSILNYDRRFFPRLAYAIHSSARLSALAYLPFPTSGAKASGSCDPQGTLISCGEYNGRGSLELYSVPLDHTTSSTKASDECVRYLLSSDTTTEQNTKPIMETFSSGTDSANTENSEYASGDAMSGCNDWNNPTPPGHYSYKNRQNVSASKLLSVASQGTRIVFSDADGSIKWVERDGRSIVRRWNINSYQLPRDSFPRLGSRKSGAGAIEHGSGLGAGRFETSLHGEEVVRKIIPTGAGEADDLLVWTGERVGMVRFGWNGEFYDAEEGVVGASDGIVRGSERDEGVKDQAEEYDRQMRRALERQADELNWMGRFGFGSSTP